MEGLEKLFASESLLEKVMHFKGIEIKIKYRELTWTEKNKVVSESFTLHTDGQTMRFDLDLYKKTCLTKMIKEAPWGETNAIFLNRLNPAFGAMLETIVPKVGQEIVEQQDFFEEGSEVSSQEQPT